MVEALRYFVTSLLAWIGYAVPDFVEMIDIADFGIIFIVFFAITIFIKTIGGYKHG